MKKFISLLLEETKRFLGHMPSKTQDDHTHQNHLLNQIELALYKNSLVHIISSNQQVTGKITMYDQQQKRLIIRHLQNNMVSLMYLRDVQRISLLPTKWSDYK